MLFQVCNGRNPLEALASEERERNNKAGLSTQSHPQKHLDNNICVQYQIVQSGAAIWSRSLAQNKDLGDRLGNQMAVAENCTGAGRAEEGCSLHSSQALSDPRAPRGFWCALLPSGKTCPGSPRKRLFFRINLVMYFYSSSLLGSQEIIWPRMQP